jgi:hypothetical protein
MMSPDYASPNERQSRPATPKLSLCNRNGNADKTWVRRIFNSESMFSGSYDYKGWLYSDMNFADGNDFWEQLMFSEEASIERPARTPVFFDENWSHTWPLVTDLPARTLYTRAGINNRKHLGMGRSTIARRWGRDTSAAPRNLASGQKMPCAIEIGMRDRYDVPIKLVGSWSFYWHLGWQPDAASASQEVYI